MCLYLQVEELEEEEEDEDTDVDYTLPRRGRRKRVGRLKTRFKRAVKEGHGQFECAKCNKVSAIAAHSGQICGSYGSR